MSSKASKKEANKLEVPERLKLASQFQEVPEFKKFMDNVNREKELKMKIKELQKYDSYFIFEGIFFNICY